MNKQQTRRNLARHSFVHKMLAQFLLTTVLIGYVVTTTTAATSLTTISPESSSYSGAPVIAPFAFGNYIEERLRASLLCTISSGDLQSLQISWLKDGQLLTPAQAAAKNITIKLDTYESALKFAPVRLEQAGNYTCVARNRIGVQTYSAQLVVHAEPRWLREPKVGPLQAARGHTVVIDCQTVGWPKPQQSWLIKTATQGEYEPLAATGRISLAANGSLVIRNADKSDEANYLCKSSNGIGRILSYYTSLKVTVPAHFEWSNRMQASVVRRQDPVQLRCDAYGDEPLTIEWFKNSTKQRLNNELDARLSIHNSALEAPRNGLVSVLVIRHAMRQDNSVYECVTRNQAGRDRQMIELVVQEEPDNIQELQASQVSSRTATLSWLEPYEGRAPITNYMFQYKRLASELPVSTTNTNELESSIFVDSANSNNQQQQQQVSTTADDWQQAARITLSVQQVQNGSSSQQLPVRSIVLEKLEPSSRYVVRALAINAIGQSKFSQPMEFGTLEVAPELAPQQVRAQALNSTSIQVSWDELPRFGGSSSRSAGRILGYYIGHRLLQNGQPSSNFVYKPYLVNDLVALNHQQDQQQQQYLSPVSPRLDFTIHELRRDTSYEINVMAFNGHGSGPSSEPIVCKTIEMEAPKPVKVSIRRESNESIFIEWQRDPQDQNPVDDYVIYQEKNTNSQEWLQVRLPGNQTQYKAPGLKCGTRYQFYVVAQNKVGKSLPSEVVGGSTLGSLPLVPTKAHLIKMLNSTCLLLNLNSFQDHGCRIKTFNVRYRAEKAVAAVAGNSFISPSSLSGVPGPAALQGTPALVGGGKQIQSPQSQQQQQEQQTVVSEWTTIRPKSNNKHQRANSDEDRLEYLCDLSPVGEYTLHVAASNDVGRSEVEYTVLMSSDELKPTLWRDLAERLYQLPNPFAYVPSVLLFLLAGLLVTFAILLLYTQALRYYDKFVIMKNQMRATSRAKRDERRRRKLNKARHSQKQLDLWAEEYEDNDDDVENLEENCVEFCDEDELELDGDDEGSSSGASHQHLHHHHHHQQQQQQQQHQYHRRRIALAAAAHQQQHLAHRSSHNQLPRGVGSGHYLANLANSNFDSSSIDGCNNQHQKCSSSCGHSTASTDSIHGRFQCLNSKQYVKMNEYTMLPTISARLSPPSSSDIYGVARGATNAGGPSAATSSNATSSNNSLYYSTLRRSSMQTYLPRQRQQQPTTTTTLTTMDPNQHQRRRSQNVSDIYGYYMAPPQQAQQPTTAAVSAPGNNQQQQKQQQVMAADEVANSIFVPPQQIIYSAPNIRRPPVFL